MARPIEPEVFEHYSGKASVLTKELNELIAAAKEAAITMNVRQGSDGHVRASLVVNVDDLYRLTFEPEK